MEFNTIQTDAATQQYLQSNLGKLRQLTRIRLQWLCSRYDIKYDPKHTTSETMVKAILETGLPVPDFHEIKKPKDWGKGSKRNTDALKKEAKKQIESFKEPEDDTEPADEGKPKKKAAPVSDDPHKIKNYFQLKKFMVDAGFEFEGNPKKADLLKMYDEKVEANG